METAGELPAATWVRSSKYRNNLIEQDHWGVKLWIGPKFTFKWFETAAVSVAGVELLLRIGCSGDPSAVSLRCWYGRTNPAPSWNLRYHQRRWWQPSRAEHPP